jgi:hypothetical protein
LTAHAWPTSDLTRNVNGVAAAARQDSREAADIAEGKTWRAPGWADSADYADAIRSTLGLPPLSQG